METFGYVVLSILILLVMVLIHELGHYTTAKILGFTIDEFAVGFGPKILSRRRKNGEMFSLRLLPLGGFCAFYGENDEEPEKKDIKAAENKSDTVNENVSAPESTESHYDTAKCPEDVINASEPEKKSNAAEQKEDEDLLSYVMRTKPSEAASESAADQKAPVRLDKFGNPAKTFNQQKPWKRLIVLFGGVLFNFLSAIVFSLIYLWAVGYSVPQVMYVYPEYGGDGVATYCALREGDLITAVNGEYISVMKSYDDIMKSYSDLKEGDSLVYTVIREGEEVEVKVVKQKIEYTAKNDDGTEELKSYVGFGFSSNSNTTFIGNNAKNAFTYCVPYTFKLSWAILGSFGELITGKVPITSVSGPIGSITLMAKLSALDWRNVLILLPLLASNLAIFNILPFPALDGSRVVFTVIEWIRKKPINRKVEGMIHAIGMGVLLLFVLVVDILFFAL
ncbi:MAG: site-2 protease family protein [Clostridiales bacterium]|nr:site-2 protease family protein [Clostridiales bacterium]